MTPNFEIYGDYVIFIVDAANSQHQALLRFLPNPDCEPPTDLLRLKQRFPTEDQARQAAHQYVDRQSLRNQIGEIVDELTGNQVDGQRYLEFRNALRKLAELPNEVEIADGADIAVNLIGGWKFDIGDEAVASEEATENHEGWSYDMIIIGKIWADKRGAGYFDGHEERIQPGYNYLCRVKDEPQYIEFHHESVLSPMPKANVNNAVEGRQDVA